VFHRLKTGATHFASVLQESGRYLVIGPGERRQGIVGGILDCDFVRVAVEWGWFQPVGFCASMAFPDRFFSTVGEVSQ